ncbi:MAG: biliverdin-producing heme oxygenase [Solirubrobacteraceae bacterium]|nr:biliverdin-producing heme oxygenase [Solirubrobacteraceae bacterium]
MESLRAATRERHTRIEARVDAENSFASIGTYREFLTRLYGFHAPFSLKLEARSSAFPELLPLPPRADLLALDLLVLGTEASTLPVCTDLPTFASDAEAVGGLYVVEGSALGGAVLARLAGRKLELDQDTGTAFLSGSEGLSARWKLLIARIDSTAEQHGADGIIDGACRTFDAMEAWLCR